MKTFTLAAMAVLGFSSLTLAHPGHESSGLSAGLLHPITGIDHLLAMVAVGVWSIQQSDKRKWLLLLLFVSFMAIGMGIGVSGWVIPKAEIGIQASVVILGLLLAFRWRMLQQVAAILIALFAIAHGYAHGTEISPDVNHLAFAVGMLAATAVLHVTGISIGLAATKQTPANLVRIGGSVMAVYGVLLLAGVV